MTTDKNIENETERKEAIISDSAESDEIVPALAGEPVAPRKLPDKDAEEIRTQAVEIVALLEGASSGKEMELLDNVSNVGVEAKRGTNNQLDLLKVRMGDILDQGGTGKEIADGLRELKTALQEISPESVTHRSVISRALGAVPFVGNHYNPIVRALNRIALRYEPVSKQVSIIETRLLDGRALLVRDNIELRKLYEDIEAHQLGLQRNAYLGELLIRELTALIERTEDPLKRDRLEGGLHDVATRVQDLRTIEQVHLQFFVSIEMGRQNNNRLGQSVERTVALATNVVMIGLAIQSALVRQKKVQEATRRTREFLGDLVEVNARSIRTHTDEIGDLYNSPVIAAEKLTRAHDDLVAALETAGRLRHEGIASARENITRLNQLSSKLAEKVRGLSEEDAAQSRAIEA